MVVMKRCIDAAPVRSYLVEILQQGLVSQGIALSAVDGEFGPATQAAVKAWQKKNNLPQSGEVNDDEWRRITGLPPPSLFDRLLHIVAQFEGTGFSGVVGNFDGAFLTFGIIGFTLASDLPGLLKDIEKAIPTQARQAFGTDKWNELLKVAGGTTAQRRVFGDSISLGPTKYGVVESWRQAFARLGKLREVQRLQLDRALKKYWIDIAVPNARELKAVSSLDIAVIYDLAVQNGGLNAKKRKTIKTALATKPGAAGEARRRLWAKGIAQGSSATYYQDVLSRKLTMAVGTGTVHMAKIDVSCWGLYDTSIDIDELESQSYTLAPAPKPVAGLAYAMEPPMGAVAAVKSGGSPWTEEVAVPSGLNAGLTAVNNALMAKLFGSPRGNYNQNCQPPSNQDFKKLCSFNVHLEGLSGVLWGMEAAVASLRRVLDDIKEEKPEIYALLGHEGMGCCRYQRGSSTAISNHSWGAAIDLTINGKLDVRGNNRMMRGILEIAPIFKRHKWYSGATFRTEDAMHMEISREWLQENMPELKFDKSSTSGFLSAGDSGPDVMRLQILLNKHGANLRVDGDFGAATLLAVKALQGAHGLKVDGVVGPETFAKLTLAPEPVEQDALQRLASSLGVEVSSNAEDFCQCVIPPQSAGKSKAALLREYQWPNGSVITCRFIGGDKALRARVEAIAKEWTGPNMANLELRFVQSGNADIRIAFEAGRGSWSYLGTYCHHVSKTEPTMNFGWLTPSSSEVEIRRVVLHEFGHALGLIHEHQNPKRPIKWDKPAVRKDLSGPPNNWDNATIENNMFKKYDLSELTATSLDPSSIMLYPVPKRWTTDGFSVGMNSQLSATDRELIRKAYPH